ncbi:MAG: recombination factor protein RarA, partial [Ramlibacter sp.]|nr:recombination factor protein RarA [Ramlibacter sp.]
DEDGGFAAGESYFPEGMQPPQLYRPVERGLEIRLADKLRELKKLNDEKK